MWHFRLLAVVAATLPAVLYCQPRPREISFEVASIKPVPIGWPSTFEETPKRILYRCILLALVQRAYEIKPYQLANPEILKKSLLYEQYEIQATLPPSATKSDIPAMLRSFLEHRFHFSAHWQEKPMSVYKLKVDSAGLILKRLELGEPPLDTPVQVMAPRTGLTKFSGTVTLQQFAAFLTSGMDRPVLDSTEAPGIFHISLDARVPPREVDLSGLPLFKGKNVDGVDDSRPPADISLNGTTLYGNVPDIDVALRKLGLRLEKAQENIRVLVIDSVDKMPSKD